MTTNVNTDPADTDDQPDLDPADEAAEDLNPLLLPRREWTVELYRPGVEKQLADLREQIEQLELADATGSGPPRKQARKPKQDVLAEEHDKIASSASKLVLAFLEPTWDEYEPLLNAHPPRPDNALDQRIGYNRGAVMTDLVYLALQTADGKPINRAQYDEFRASVSAINWSKITDAVNDNVDREPQLPKPLAVSALQRKRERDSQPQPATGRRRGGSKE